MSDELVEIANYANRLEADLVVQRLEAAGINAIRSSDGAGGTLPSLAAATGGHRVTVRAEDQDAALALLSEDTADD